MTRLSPTLDRHHENWGILVDPGGQEPPELAPTFDHASSLGYQLSDTQRFERIHTNDRGFSVEAYPHRASSRHFEGQPNLVALAGAAARLAGAEVPGLLSSRLAQLDDAALTADLRQLPDGRMSQAARIFALRMLVENRRRLLDELDR